MPATTSPFHALSMREMGGHKPDFDELPLEADYWATQEKAKSSDAKNIQIAIIK